MNLIPLAQTFYEPSAEWVAPQLLGHWLIRKMAEGFCGGPIVETEAYLMDDPASHGFIGETARNRVMYGPPGRAYIYQIYGNHFCVNAVCRQARHAEAVLIRAIEAEFGEELLRHNRAAASIIHLTNGPGKLCGAMRIDRKLDGADLCAPDSPLMIARNPSLELFCKERGPRVKTTRVGITKAAHLPLRFYLEGSRFVSKRTPGARPRSRLPAG
jgi:DNA-3-methyladenine glycosylase